MPVRPGAQNHHAGLQVFGQIGDHLFRQAFFHVGELFLNAEFLPQCLHGDQMLAADGVVVDARIEIGQLDGDVDRGNGIGADR